MFFKLIKINLVLNLLKLGKFHSEKILECLAVSNLTLYQKIKGEYLLFYLNLLPYFFLILSFYCKWPIFYNIHFPSSIFYILLSPICISHGILMDIGRSHLLVHSWPTKDHLFKETDCCCNNYPVSISPHL